MRTYWNVHQRVNKEVGFVFRIDLQSWYIGFDFFKNYAVGANEIKIQILCFAFGFRRYWEI